MNYFNNKFLIYRFILSILISSSIAWAHPNLKMNYHVFFKFKGIKVTDVGETWIFDKITSNELINRYKLKQKRSLNKKESKAIGKEIMEGLSSVRYFTYIFVNGYDLGKIKTSGYKAQIKNGIFTFAFNNHLPSPIDVTKKHLSIQVKDPDSTITINLAKRKPIIFLGANEVTCKISIKNKRRKGMVLSYDAYNMGMLLPDKEIGIFCENKS